MTRAWIIGFLAFAGYAWASADDTSGGMAPAGSDGVIRIVVEAEEMRGVSPNAFGGSGPDWLIGRAGIDTFQKNGFGAHGQSRLRTVMTDAGANPAELTAAVDIPTNGTYRLWVKYECRPLFNSAFEVSLRHAGLMGAEAFRKTFGLLASSRHYGSATNGGCARAAAEGGEVTLEKGRYTLRINKTINPEPAGPRSIDAVLFTTDLSPGASRPSSACFLLGELRRANHLFMRFRVPADAPAPLRITWSAEAECRFDRTLSLKPGDIGAWLDIGHCLDVDTASTLFCAATALDSTGQNPASHQPPVRPFFADIALSPTDKAIVNSFAAEDDGAMAFVLQPDLKTAEGAASSRSLAETYRAAAQELDREPRLASGLPQKMRFFGGTRPVQNPVGGQAGALKAELDFRRAVGLNTDPGPVPEDTNSITRMMVNGGEAEASPLFVEFLAGCLKSAAKTGGRPTRLAGLPQLPGQSAEWLLQGAILAIGQNVRDLDWGFIPPTAARGGISLFKALRQASDMAAFAEKWLERAKPSDAAVALLIPESGDAVVESSRQAYYALRNAGYRVDLVTLADCREGYLPRYKALYGGGENKDLKSIPAVAEWAARGGILIDSAAGADWLVPLSDSGLRPDIRSDKPNLACNRLTGPRGTVVTVANLGLPAGGAAESVKLEIDGVSRVGRVWSYAFPKGLESASEGNCLTVTLPRLGLADVLVIEK
ncbi:MAG: hypothetical protein R6X19_06190 [Kiritimatiellia bacterium]